MTTKRTIAEMSPNEVREWLDEGNTFALLAGQGRYVARKAPDGSYLVYHYNYSTFGRVQQYSARYQRHYSQNEPEELGEPLADVPVDEQRSRLDAGEVFTAPISNGENFKIARMSDGAYIQYIPQRQTFEEAWGRIAQNGPAARWEKSGEDGEPPSTMASRRRNKG